MKKVSVIIPVYNAESYLNECLDSILSQSYKNLEVICVDDGSTDNSIQRCKEYANNDSRIIVLHQHNCGVSKARNKGIEISSGDFIFFLDGDDYLDPECINNLVKEYERGYSPIVGYKLNITSVGIKEVNQSYGEYDSLLDYLKDFHKYFATKFSFVWGKLFDSNIIKENKIYFHEDIMLGEDMLFNLNYYTHYRGKISVIKYDGYYYRQSGMNSLSKRFDINMINWNVKSFMTLVEFLKNHNMYNSENRAHLLANACNNFKYNFHLLALNTQYSLQEKMRIIKDTLSIAFVKEAVQEGRARMNCYQQILIYLLRHNYIWIYLRLEKFRCLLK